MLSNYDISKKLDEISSAISTLEKEFSNVEEIVSKRIDARVNTYLLGEKDVSKISDLKSIMRKKYENFLIENIATLKQAKATYKLLQNLLADL